LVLFKVVFHDLPTKKSSPEPVSTAVTEVAEVVTNNDEEIVAVIAAAIAMAESESSGVKFKVVSFKRK
jgi:Na+-transporting methylmalonyl-CoA/oxaloacetate decarboxylase gamma subunit